MTDSSAVPSRSEFMAEAAALLAGSIDYQEALDTLAHLSVPRVADWCAIDEVDDAGRVRRIAVAHPDPERERLAHEIAERYPPDPDAPHGVPQVLRTGTAELVPEIPEALLEAAAQDDEHRRIIRSLGLTSYMVVPLRARGRMLGAITFVSAESGRRFGPEDLAFAQELADRAALAVDNARLLRDAEAARRQTERILESITDAFFALDGGWRFTYVNDEAERLLQRPRAELLRANLWEAFPDAVGSSFEREYERAVRERRTAEFEEFFPSLDAWFEVRAYPSEEGLSVYFRDVSDRVRAQEAFQRQSQLTRTISDNATSALFMMDARGHCTYMNPAAEAMTGFTLAEVRDIPLHDAIHHRYPDGRPFPMSECPIDRALPEDYSVRAHEDVFIRKDGSFFPVVCAAAPIFDDRGVPVGTVVEVRDVTDERASAAALRESEERYRFQSETMPAQVWTARADGSLDYVSAPTAAYFGVSAETLLAEGWRSVVHPDDLAEVGERWQRSLATGEPYEMEFRLRGAEGGFRWHLARATARRGAEGVVDAWFGVNTDIEDRRRAQQDLTRLVGELEAERSRLAELFRNAPAFIAVLRGAEHRFEMANPPYQRLVGGKEVVGRTVADALPEVVEQGFIDILDGVYQSGEPFIGNEVPIRLQRAADGEMELRHVNFVYQPVREADRTISGIFVHGVDITEQVVARQEVERKAEELARLARALEASNRELDQFAYVASHDLKAPLRGISNLSQWIEEDMAGCEITAETRTHLDLLRGRVHRMEGLIDGILQYSRAGRVREQSEPVDTAALMGEVLDLLDPPGTVQIVVEEGMPTVVVERLPLQQVFMNLVGNALKYGRAEYPEIRVEWADVGREWEFRVADNGPGIAPEYHERIFGIFQTLQARDEVEGTGIGLSLVRKIVESRGGRVWVESEEGGGATFRFRIPKDPPGAAT